MVRLADGSVAAGRALPGRGAWLCRASAACVERAVRRGALARALRGRLAAEAPAELARQMGIAADVRGWTDTPAPRPGA